jgi:hypothetical protein
MDHREPRRARARRASQAHAAGILAGVRQHGLVSVEAAAAIAAGVIASPIALAGFGLDSVIEFAAAAVVAWQLRGENQDRETRAVRLIGVTFFALAAYLTVESISDLISQARPGQSPAGIAVTSAALLVMPSLAVSEHRTGTALGNRTLIADAAVVSAFCAFTSAAALLALGLNAWPGWWRADPAAALVIAALAARKASKPGKRTDRHGAGRAARQSRRRSAAVTPGHTPWQPRRDRGDDPPGNPPPGPERDAGSICRPPADSYTPYGYAGTPECSAGRTSRSCR